MKLIRTRWDLSKESEEDIAINGKLSLAYFYLQRKLFDIFIALKVVNKGSPRLCPGRQGWSSTDILLY
jgi:hypothetical protein